MLLYLLFVGQAVKTPPSHGGNTGSIPVRTALLYNIIAQPGNKRCLQRLFLFGQLLWWKTMRVCIWWYVSAKSDQCWNGTDHVFTVECTLNGVHTNDQGTTETLSIISCSAE